MDEYAQRHGQDPAAVLDEALPAYLEWERQDFDNAVATFGRGDADVKAGSTRPVSEFLADMRRKYGLLG